MKVVYPVFFTSSDNEILVEVPDLEILTQGKDIEDAIDMARDAIGLKVITIEDMNEVIPQPSKIQNLDMKGSEFYKKDETVASLVDVDLVAYRKKYDNKMVRKNVTIPNWMNLEAEKRNINFSKVLQEALNELITK